MSYPIVLGQEQIYNEKIEKDEGARLTIHPTVGLQLASDQIGLLAQESGICMKDKSILLSATKNLELEDEYMNLSEGKIEAKNIDVGKGKLVVN